MTYHLAIMKRICPSTVSDITLTQEIKDTVLTSRLYRIKTEQQIVNQTINNYNQMNNFMSEMDQTPASEDSMDQTNLTTIIDKLRNVLHGHTRNEFL